MINFRLSFAAATIRYFLDNFSMYCNRFMRVFWLTAYVPEEKKTTHTCAMQKNDHNYITGWNVSTTWWFKIWQQQWEFLHLNGKRVITVRFLVAEPTVLSAYDLLKRINRFFFWSLRSISSKLNKSFNSVAHAHLSVAETHFVQFFKKNITRHFGFNALKKHRIISVRVKHISPGTTLNTLFQTFRNSWLVNGEFFSLSAVFVVLVAAHSKRSVWSRYGL